MGRTGASKSSWGDTVADIPQLSRLMRKADSVAESASVLVKRAMREIRGELANLSTELNLAGSASDREKVYDEIRRRMALLSRRMNKLMEAQNELAARSAAASASKMTGLEVKYSPKRAKAITELVTPAQGENLAAVFTDRMGRNLINSLREATVGMLREQAVAGGSMKDMARDLAARWSQAAKVDDPRFTDASGRTWDTRTYIQMNVRTNTMRVYNDCLLDDVAREVGTDLMRISSGGDPDCDCAAWEGVIISVSGQTKGLPTYEDARNAGCFHPNCTHTPEYVDEVADKKEIELQKAHPVQEGLADDPDAQDERKYEIDQARYMRDNPGMTQEEARIAVDRDNLAASIQSGLVRDDAREIVAKMTDAQVTALCPDGNPPAFEPTKRATRADPHAADEKWNHGSRGGTVHIGRDADAAHILDICKVKDGETGAVKPSKQKTKAEIMAMDVSNAVKEISQSVDWMRDAKIPQTITERESRYERAIDACWRRHAEYEQADRSNKRKPTEENLKALHVALAKYNRAYRLKEKIEDRLFAECLPWARKYVIHRADPCLINTGKMSKELPRWESARELLREIVARDVFPSKPLNVVKIKKDNRSHQSGLSIYMGGNSKVPTFVHETMHFVEEHNPHVHERCVEFLKYRTQGEDLQSLRELTGRGYDRKEVCRPDHFFNPYCGKAYEARIRHGDNKGQVEVIATEVLSMGVERLVKNPIRFLREDPEYATFCLGLIRGDI